MARKSKENQEKPVLTAPKKIKILVSVVERVKTDFYLSVLEGFDVNMQMVVYGNGTAPTDLLNYLGLNSNEKSVILSIVQESMVKEILNSYEEKYFKTKHGKGIAFTIPVDSIIGVMVYKFLVNAREGVE